jgi:phospholipase C
VLTVALLATAALSLPACSSPVHTAPAPTHPNSTSPPSASALPTPAALEHVVLILDENKPAASVIGNSAAPYLNALAHSYATATNYGAVTHPSLPNYLALTSGTTAGITSDCNPPGGACTAAVRHIGDEIADSGRTWKMYAEDMPTPCATSNSGRYAVKHVPFVYYPDVTKDHAFCRAHVVPYTEFAGDLASAESLPAYSFVSPNLCNDMHDCSVATGDAWMAQNVARILDSPAFQTQRSLLVIAFDEGDAANNVVPCIFAGPAAKRAYATATPFTHYSLLRTIELEWNLPALTANDAAAQPMTEMLG